MLSPKGLTMTPYKVQIIQDWPIPWKVKDIQFISALPTSHCRFIHGYYEITVPLTHLTPKGTPWHFSNECHSAFEALKKGFHHSSGPYPLDPDTQIRVETDTSDYALAAVLSITTQDGKLHLIAFQF